MALRIRWVRRAQQRCLVLSSLLSEALREHQPGEADGHALSKTTVTDPQTARGDQWLVEDLARNSLTKAKKDRREMAVSAVYLSAVCSFAVFVALSFCYQPRGTRKHVFYVRVLSFLCVLSHIICLLYYS